MTHLKKKWLVLLASASLLASCGNPEAKSSQEGSIPSESSNIVPPSSSEDIYDHTELEPLSDISKNISYSTSGYLGDISVGMSLAAAGTPSGGLPKPNAESNSVGVFVMPAAFAA